MCLRLCRLCVLLSRLAVKVMLVSGCIVAGVVVMHVSRALDVLQWYLCVPGEGTGLPFSFSCCLRRHKALISCAVSLENVKRIFLELLTHTMPVHGEVLCGSL